MGTYFLRISIMKVIRVRDVLKCKIKHLQAKEHGTRQSTSSRAAALVY